MHGVQKKYRAQKVVRLMVGKPNFFDSPATVAIRTAIGDAFGGGADKSPLNCTEYVQYRIQTKLGVTIQWPNDRPRNGGAWAAIFKKHGLYSVLTEPAAGCAMCFTADISEDAAINNIGHVAFVESVLPDGSVKISEANWPRDGIYNERTIPEAVWRLQYKAQFVRFV